ncbi:AAA family ATPase [Duganella sp. FT92W]|uniref:AAA family ATPase n=1 Tax=Pseudoduganella rivuli TaxID=2666085 RepID=A0A7X2IRH9_9BURK|nr:sigma 54-interacting transcriptional regulator [Pseudoduganella rivuli]MRV74711.1 AAA family ATPase [Pseudoduganella rivuli]
MDGADTLIASLHPVAPLPDGAADALVAGLGLAGVSVQPAHGKPAGLAVLLFSQWDEQAAAALAALVTDQCGNQSVLAVCCGALPANTGWSLLAAGAADVLLWPTAPAGADSIATQAAARLHRWRAVEQLMQSDAVRSCLVGDSPAWRALVRSVVEVAAWTQSPVLITGETGTGKEQIAKLIHHLHQHPGGGLHGDAPLVLLDCSTLSPELAGSEFFGHEKGAFTGAMNARDGAFAQADGGILFLDEVGELPLPLQAQLLRVIQEQQYKRLGGNHWQPTRFRLVCATNRDLDACVAAGTFRADLYYRIAGWRCRPPPLRERTGDILPLVSHFLRQLDPDHAHELDPAVREYLLTRSYPGNVRDLRQTVARIWHRHCGLGPLTIGDVPPDERLQAGAAWPDQHFTDAVRHALDLGVSLPAISQAAADTAMKLALAAEQGNNQRAAALLGISDRALQMRRKGKPDGPAYH